MTANGEQAVMIRKNSRRPWIIAALVYLVVLVVTGVGALTQGRGSSFTVLFVVAFIPVLLGPLLRYIYIRTVKPFTTELTKDEIRANSHKKCCNTWSRSQQASTVLFVIMVSIAFSAPVLVDTLASTETKPYMVFAYNFMGSLLFVLIWACLVDFCDLLFGTMIRRKNGAIDSQVPYWKSIELASSRKERQIKGVLVIMGYFLTTALSLYFAYQDPTILEQKVIIKNLPACMDGYSLLLISDVHAGPLVGKGTITRLTEQAIALRDAGRVDAVVLVGDFADGLPENVGGALADFQQVVSSTPDGVYFVPGNHEYLHQATGEQWSEFFESLGVTPLNNTMVELRPTDDQLCEGIDLIGVDDFSLGNPDLEKAVNGRDPARASVLLAHQPKQSKKAIELGIDLQLSGHVHAGQTWPLHFVTYIDQPFFAGLESDEAFQIYTSEGAFGWGPRTRLGSSNNIDIVVLKSGVALEQAPTAASVKWAIATYPLFVLTTLFCVCYGPFPLSKRWKPVASDVDTEGAKLSLTLAV